MDVENIATSIRRPCSLLRMVKFVRHGIHCTHFLQTNTWMLHSFESTFNLVHPPRLPLTTPLRDLKCAGAFRCSEDLLFVILKVSTGESSCLPNYSQSAHQHQLEAVTAALLQEESTALSRPSLERLLFRVCHSIAFIAEGRIREEPDSHVMDVARTITFLACAFEDNAGERWRRLNPTIGSCHCEVNVIIINILATFAPVLNRALATEGSNLSLTGTVHFVFSSMSDV